MVKWLLSLSWPILTAMGLLFDEPIFSIAYASTIVLMALMMLGLFFHSCVILTGMFRDLKIPQITRTKKVVSTTVGFLPGIVIAGLGHPIIGAGYICLWGLFHIVDNFCMAMATKARS